MLTVNVGGLSATPVNVTVSIDDPTVAKADGAVITGLKTGSTTYTVTYGSLTAKASLTVRDGDAAPLSGDVDGNGSVTSADARSALRRAVDLETYAPGSQQFIACDVDKSGEVNSADARVILRIAVDLESAEDYR